MENSKVQFKTKNFKFCIVILIFTFCILNLLMGCATYKFQRGREPHNKGYVVSRDDYSILEYTIGRNNSVPGLELAKKRFNKRIKMVEHYYKKMGYIENHFKMAFWDPGVLFVKLIGGVFRLPCIAISDYRYEHNPQYKERIRKIEDEKDRREEARIKKLKDALNAYIQQDLVSEQDIIAREKSGEVKFAQEEVLKETLDRVEQEMAKEKELPQEKLVQPKEEQPDNRKVEPPQTKRAKLSGQPIAVIIAKPIKGFSPLKVRFYGYKSSAPNGKIISYSWDFGDGDTSTEANPVNTYYSGSFEPLQFTIILTVQDDKGNTAKASTTIEVLNR